jgi:hypothetical protein
MAVDQDIMPAELSRCDSQRTFCKKCLIPNEVAGRMRRKLGMLAVKMTHDRNDEQRLVKQNKG